MAEDDSRTRSTPRMTFQALAAAAMELPAVKAITAAEEAAKKAARLQKAAVPLGDWADDQRGCPNVVLRSALFTAAKPTSQRKLYREHLLPAALGVTSIKYTGAQLYQYELDVWLEVVHRCRMQAAGTETEFHPYGFLKTLRRSTGKKDYQQLGSTFALLQATAIDVTTQRDAEGRGEGFVGSLVEHLRYDEKVMRWKVRLHPEITELFAPRENTWLDVDARRDLGRNWLAKWLHGYFSSHRKPLPIGVSRLRELSGSSAGALRTFRQSLRAALTEVSGVEKARRRRFEWRISDKDLVHVLRERGH